jgi:hypothetical protein
MIVGFDCKLYYNTGTHASPTWVLIPRAINVSVPDFGCNQVATPSRGSNFEAFLNGLIRTGLNFTYAYKAGTDTVLTALLGMVTGRTAKEFAVMDGAIATTGSRGLRAYFNIENAPWNQELEGRMEVDFTLKPAYFEESGSKVDPDVYVVA